MRNITVLTAVILTLMIVPTSIYALQSPASSTGATPEEIALAFIRASPTFRFDGVTSTLKAESVALDKSNPPKYLVTVGFTCLHSGYGDRAGMIVTDALTPHTAIVTVANGQVVGAVLDGEWDEVAQKTTTDEAKAVAESIALNWLINAPTFKFDGVTGSARVIDSFLAMTFAAPSFWGVTIEFDCVHAGYGDRTGQMLAQVITHHVVTIHVTDGAVTLAQVDNKWDELTQQSTEQPTILTPEQARDIAVNYIVANFGFNTPTVTEWSVEDLNPTGLVGHQTTRYTSGDWVVTVEYAVVWKPTYTVSVENGSTEWTGTVDQSGSVSSEESKQDMPRLIYTPDIARKLCIDYIIANHPGVGGGIPTEWIEKNMVPEGLLGLTKIQYTSDGWNVTVSAPVVWMPTHSVTVIYSGAGSLFTWVGTVPQGGPVQELSFSK